MSKYIIKIVALIVLTIFALSIVPGAFAKADNVNGRALSFAYGKDVTTNIKDSADNPRSINAETREVSTQNKEGKIIKATEKIEQAKEKLHQVRERYQLAKENYEQAREKYQEHKENLIQLKNRAKECQEEDCINKKRELKKGVKTHLEKTISVIESSLEKLSNRVEESTVLTEEEKNEALASISEMETKLTAKKDEILALEDNMTNEELRNAIKELKSLWQDTKTIQQKLISSLISSKIDNLVEKTDEEVPNSMQLRIDELAEKGIDILTLKTLLEEYNEKAAELAKHKEFWKNSKTKENLNQVKADLGEVKSVLRQFLMEYKELKKEAVNGNDDTETEEDDTETEDEEEEESETEVEEEDSEETESEEEETESEEETENETTEE